MRKNELVHHEHYVAKVQQDLTHFLLNDESLKNGAIKYLRWDSEMKLFDVYEDAEYKIFITHTFYERFRDIQLAKGIVCQRCGRKLKDTKWTPIGYGRRCYKKFLKEEWERNQMTIFDFIDDPEYEIGGVKNA
ncbi:hypothetical protein ACFSY7_03160 [Kurthia populi]|uniref:Uncharacterized protein n=1 Tax=Kurthia populi TaxID=1562132 RepID=A0ABW5XWY6_9BACL